MNQPADIERTLQRWMADGPATMPDRVVDVVAARIAVNRQRRVGRFLGRNAPMPSRSISYLAGAAAVLVAVVGLALIGGRQQGTGPSVSPSPTPTPPASPSPESAAWWLAGRDGCGSCTGALSIGAQSSSNLEPTLTYTAPTGWINSYDTQNAYELVPDTSANRSLFASGSQAIYYLTVNRNQRVDRADCSNNPVSVNGFSPDDIVDTLAAREGLDVTPPAAVSIGGLSGKQIDLAVASDWTGTCPGGGDMPAVATFTNGEAHWWAVLGERKRVIALAGPQGASIVVEIAAPTDGFDDHLAASMAIVDTFRFETTP